MHQVQTEPIEGFFNDIPSEPAVTVQMQNKTEPYAAGFISSSRLDEAEFTLHAVNHTVAEKLTLDNGDPAPKLGYAYGTFTSGDGQLRARELRLIVVNATTVNVQAIQWLHDILDNVNAFKG